jgi:hypothetical protein
MEPACNNFLVLNIIFAVVNTILMGILVWQLWVVRSRVDRFEYAVASLVEGVVSRVRWVAVRVSALVRHIGRAAQRR